jgi:histidinol-phosphate aminotransferase
MQTFSIAYGLAAVRVGMAFSSPAIIQFFNKLKPPYNISYINQQAVLKKLGNFNDYNKQVARIKKERIRLAHNLSEMKIVEKVYPSDANFLLIKVKDANSIYSMLVNQNIIIRNRSSVIENCLRITVGKKSENDKLIKALREL